MTDDKSNKCWCSTCKKEVILPHLYGLLVNGGELCWDKKAKNSHLIMIPYKNPDSIGEYSLAMPEGWPNNQYRVTVEKVTSL